MVGEHKSEDFCIECSKGIDMDKIKRICQICEKLSIWKCF